MCNCNVVWGCILPPPPCPVHSRCCCHHCHCHRGYYGSITPWTPTWSDPSKVTSVTITAAPGTWVWNATTGAATTTNATHTGGGEPEADE